MSETAERSPQGMMPEQEDPQPRMEDMSRQTRLEDLPEFQKLAPEQQEKLLSLRERMMNEAMNPERVVTRSINEMGFWEGMKETVKPHAEKKMKLMKSLRNYRVFV